MLIETQLEGWGGGPEAYLPGVLGAECSNESPSEVGISSKTKLGSRGRLSSRLGKGARLTPVRVFSGSCVLLPSEETSGFGNGPCMQEKSLIPSIGSVIWDLSTIIAGERGGFCPGGCLCSAEGEASPISVGDTAGNITINVCRPLFYQV